MKFYFLSNEAEVNRYHDPIDSEMMVFCRDKALEGLRIQSGDQLFLSPHLSDEIKEWIDCTLIKCNADVDMMVLER